MVNLLGGHRGDPFTRVNVSMNDNCWLGSFTSTSPDVDTSLNSSLNGGSKGDNLGLASISSLEVFKELNMVSIRMVCCEPRLAGN